MATVVAQAGPDQIIIIIIIIIITIIIIIPTEGRRNKPIHNQT